MVLALAAQIAGAAQIDIHGPLGSVAFGTSVRVLPSGNIVVTDPNGPVSNVGAVYLYSPAGVLISTLTGSTANDQVGSGGIVVLSNGNYVILSPGWNNGVASSAGAVTWADGSAGVSGVVSAANSIVGTSASDRVGIGGVTVLSNGKFLILSPVWNNGGASAAGAVTWVDNTKGISGIVSAANSLVGTATGDNVGNPLKLSNGNYVVASPNWGADDVGAVTWGNGAVGTVGAVSGSNSLIGTHAGDRVGTVIAVIGNGNFVVLSPSWFGGLGAVTWGNGAVGIVAEVSGSNSLIGVHAGDRVGSAGITVLANGNYVVRSPAWFFNLGAVTWGNSATGILGAVSPANSLVGSTGDDFVGTGGVAALSNGNYVVLSPSWDAGSTADVGAATWANGSTGISGVISAENSLVGTTSGDGVGINGAVALNNGNYVVASPAWSNGSTANVGAATWGNGGTGIFGAVSVGNSLIGTTASDRVSAHGITTLPYGNYVVRSGEWRNGAAAAAGAATWGNGSIGIAGVVSAANSLVGTSAGDQVGRYLIRAIGNGNYVVASPYWDNGGAVDAGAATWGYGATGISGVVSPANSLVGTTSYDYVGFDGVIAFGNGNYVVVSSAWSNGGALNAGAVTWANGFKATSAVVSVANSLVGTTSGDLVGDDGVAAIGASYVVASRRWDNGGAIDAGAISLGRGSGGTVGPIASTNSVLGTVAMGGSKMLSVYDSARDTLVVGQPAANLVSLFKADLLFTNGFE